MTALYFLQLLAIAILIIRRSTNEGYFLGFWLLSSTLAFYAAHYTQFLNGPSYYAAATILNLLVMIVTSSIKPCQLIVRFHLMCFCVALINAIGFFSYLGSIYYYFDLYNVLFIIIHMYTIYMFFVNDGDENDFEARLFIDHFRYRDFKMFKYLHTDSK